MILGIICCRGELIGAVDKHIQLLNDKPMIAYTIETANQCSMLDDVIVSTDSEEIAEVAIQYGAKVPFMRSKSLATDEASKWPVFLHAVERYEQQFGKTISYIVDMDATVPLKTVTDIEGAIRMALLYPETDVVITGYVPANNPYLNMMEVTSKGYAEIVKKSDEPIVRRKDAPKVFSLTGAAFVVKKTALYNYSHWSQAVCRIYEIPRKRALDIDQDLDFELIKILLNKHHSK